MAIAAADITLDSIELKRRVERFQSVRDAILAQVRQVIVGQEEVLDQILTALFVGGHCLITGLPGTAKTLMVRTIAQTLGLIFRRIQFTPDLMPSDITGTDIIEEDPTTGHRRWTFVPGPIFGNIVLADEINRTPPKTQAALLEAMQELSCTVRGNHYQLPTPFFVLATQNPIELEGTYPRAAPSYLAEFPRGIRSRRFRPASASIARDYAAALGSLTCSDFLTQRLSQEFRAWTW